MSDTGWQRILRKKIKKHTKAKILSQNLHKNKLIY